MLKPADIDALVARIVARTDPEQVILFGSYAKGRATSGSDLDLFVIQDTVQPRARRAAPILPLVATCLVRVDVHVYTPEEVAIGRADPLSFVSSVLRTGCTLFERGAQARSESDADAN